MKVIFLDFDGVLNTHTYVCEDNGGEGPEFGLDPEAIKLVNEIIRRTGAVVVLTTAWRYDHSQQDLTRFLEARGFGGQVQDITELTALKSNNVMYVWRETEVRAWLLNNRSVESFVVLDDLDEFRGMQDHHIHTDADRGLLAEHVDLAVNILSRVVDQDEVHGLRETTGA